MSLILDALRKSEHQRQRQSGPGLAVVPEGAPHRRPGPWLFLLGGLLILNVAVLATLLLTGRPASPPGQSPPPAAASMANAPTPAPLQAPAAATPPPRSVAAPVQLPAKPPRSEVRPLTTEIAPAAPAPRAPATGQAAPTGTQDMARAPAPAPETSAAARARDTEDARLPRYTDLVVRGELNVPHLHIDIHVYSENPAQRFVFINMRRYDEGQATSEGPRVERITPLGVVMDYQGQRFFLSRD
jgi:general secretion pathway protein B